MMIHINKIVILLVLVLMFSANAFSQSYINSAYSFYGVGDISPKGFGTNTMLGGTGYALRDGYSINNLNPASYNAISQPITQLTEFAWDVSYGNWIEEGESYSQSELSFQGLSMWFRLNNRSGLVLGLNPFSKVDYNITTSNSLDGLEGDYDVNYIGSGGLSKFYVGSAYELMNNLSVGVDVSVIFGPLNQDMEISSNDLYLNYSNKRQVSLSGVTFDAGIQYTQPIKNSSITLGAVYSHKKDLKAVTSNLLYNDSDTLLENSGSLSGYYIPRTVGGGISYEHNKKWLITADYEYQFWNEFDNDRRYAVHDSQRYAVGIEFLPDLSSLSYFKRVTFGVGAFYRNSYLEVDDQPINDFGFTGGLKLPTGGKLLANLTYQRLFRANETENLIRENYHNITLNLAFFDFWFQKNQFN